MQLVPRRGAWMFADKEDYTEQFTGADHVTLLDVWRRIRLGKIRSHKAIDSGHSL